MLHAGCNGSAECVFPNATIPQHVWAASAQRLLQYIPAPNSAAGTFSASASNQTSRDDKGAVRLDADTRWGQISAYYFIDDFDLDNPYPVAQSGTSVPGFNALTAGRAQLISLGNTKSFHVTAINEFHLSYMRDDSNLGQPVGGRNPVLHRRVLRMPRALPALLLSIPKGRAWRM
ncbi:MAG: outer membrane beta-barrel protein [Acidobacteriaceae bacterium]